MNNDKKKMMVVGGLGLALVAIGAFQFIPKKSPAPTPPAEAAAGTTASTGTAPTSDPANGKPKEGKKSDDPQRDELIAMIQPLPQRDPFSPQSNELETKPTNPVVPVQQPVNPPVARPMGDGNNHSRIPGGIPPFDPSQGGGLPPVGNNPDSPVVVDKGKPLRQPEDLAYEVKGVMVGEKPMAVFEDDSGNQRLVPLGGSLDRDSKVVGIEKGKVRIRHKGKDKTLRLPEGP